MPNGKLGDDPLNDILLYKRPTFSPEIDTLIVEIVALGGRRELETQFTLFAPPPLELFGKEIRAMRDRLKREAKERGWEIENT